MTKADMKKKIVEKLDGKTSQEAASYAIDLFIEVITEALASGDNVMLKGFGAFKVKPTKARTGRNPKTGQAVQIPAGRKVTFTVSKELKTRVGGGE